MTNIYVQEEKSANPGLRAFESTGASSGASNTTAIDVRTSSVMILNPRDSSHKLSLKRRIRPSFKDGTTISDETVKSMSSSFSLALDKNKRVKRAGTGDILSTLDFNYSTDSDSSSGRRTDNYTQRNPYVDENDELVELIPRLKIENRTTSQTNTKTVQERAWYVATSIPVGIPPTSLL